MSEEMNNYDATYDNDNVDATDDSSGHKLGDVALGAAGAAVVYGVVKGVKWAADKVTGGKKKDKKEKGKDGDKKKKKGKKKKKKAKAKIHNGDGTIEEVECDVIDEKGRKVD